MTPPTGSDAPPQVFVDNDVLRETYERARAENPGTFIAGELAWLDEHSTLAFIVIDQLFRNEAKGRNPDDVAGPARQGALLGTCVVRGMIDLAQIDLDQVVANHRKRLMGNELLFAEEIELQGLTSLFGEKVSGSLSIVRHPIARTMCAVMLWASLDNREQPPPEVASFIRVVNTMRRPRSPDKRVIGAR